MFALPSFERFDLSLVLRGLAATAVVWWHIHGYQAPGLRMLNIPGRVGVWVFFGLSGYVIAHGFFRHRYEFSPRSLAVFAARRAFRIFPLFVLITVVTCATFVLQQRSIPFGIREIPAQIFMLQWWHDYALIGVFWTLGVEMQFYLIAPVVIWLIMRAGDRGLFYGTLAWIALWIWPWASEKLFGTSLDDRTTLGNLHHFLTGILICKAAATNWFEERIIRTSWPSVFVGLAIVVLLIDSALYHRNERQFFELRGALLTDMAIAIFLIAHCALENRHMESSVVLKFMMMLGILSYGLYAWHGYLLVCFPWFQQQFLTTFAVSLLAAYISFVLVERPFISLAHRAAT